MEEKPTLIYLKEAARAAHCFIGKTLQERGVDDLGPQAAHILFYLSKNKDASSGDLREAQGSSKASISEGLATLVDKGYIEYQSSERDRREKRIVLTEKGIEHQRRASEAIQSAITALLEGVPPEEEERLKTTLMHIIHNAKGGEHV